MFDGMDRILHNGSKMEPRGKDDCDYCQEYPPRSLRTIKDSSPKNRRSINGEVISILEKAVSIPPIDVKATLERTRKLRELTAHYVITNEELTRWKNEGRK